MDWIKEKRPLSEWTLAEVKEFCKDRTKHTESGYYECYGCDLHGKVCQCSPDSWRLEGQYEP